HQAHFVYRPAQIPSDTVVQLADQFLCLIDYVNHNGLNVTLANVHQCIGESNFALPLYRNQPLADCNSVKHEALVESQSEPVVASSEQTRIWLDSQNNHHRFYHLVVIRPQEVVDSARVQSAIDGLTKQFPILVSRFVDQLNQVFRYEAIDSSNLAARVTIDEALFNEPVKLRSVLHDAHCLDDADHTLFSVVELVSNGSDRIEWLSVYCHYVLGDRSKFHYWVEQFQNLIRNPPALPLSVLDANDSGNSLDPTEFWKTHLSDGTLYLELDGQPSQPLNHTCDVNRYEPAIPSSLVSHLPLLMELMSMSYLELLQGFMALFLLRLAQQSSVALLGQADHNSAVPWVAQTKGKISAKDALYSLVEQYRKSTQYDWSQFSFPADSRKPSIRVTALSMLPGCGYDFSQSYAETPLSLTWLHRKDNSALKLVIDYDKGVYQMATVEHLVKNLLFFTSQCCADITQDWRDVDVVHPDEQSLLLNEFATTKHDYDLHDAKAEGVLDLFIRNVSQYPESVAVEYGDHRETYHSLYEKVQALVTHLHSIGVQRQERIAVVVENNAFTIMTLLALWTLGAVYVPIDSQLPQERQQYMIETAGCTRVFSTTFTKPDWIEAIAIQEVVDNMSSNKVHAVLPDGNIKHMPDEIAYIVFTSGTTGQPKGLTAHYGAFNNLIITHPLFARECPQESRWLIMVGVAFDPYLYGTFLSLCFGWTLVLASHETAMHILPTIHGIVSTPSFIAALEPENYPKLKWISIGGEALPQSLSDKWSPRCRLYNGYGPTEVTVVATTKEVKPGDRVTIGRPLPNRKCYILDNRQQLLPIGTIGEIYIGGVGVSQGYINRTELNETRFIPNPFAAGRLYRTGDYGRWLPSGELECLGRADDQVKIRGFRVEIGEIRGALLKQPGVRDAFVMLVDGKQLAGYVICHHESGINEDTLRKELEKYLPPYMVPHYLVLIHGQAGFPRTINGKVDQVKLRQMLEANLLLETEHENCTALSDDKLPEPQCILRNALLHVLNIEKKVMRWERSFVQLGGDSISAIQVSSKCRQSGWSLSVSIIMKNQPIRMAVDSMTPMKAQRSINRTKVGYGVAFPLTPVQQWFFGLPMENNHRLSMSVLVELFETIPVDTLNHAFRRLVDHHDMLRGSFTMDDDNGSWTQQVMSPGTDTYYPQVQVLTCPDEASLNTVTAPVQCGMNIAHGPLLAAALVTTDDSSIGFLYLTVHHVVTDLVSWSILMEDLHQLIRDPTKPLEEVGYSFMDWAVGVDERVVPLGPVTKNSADPFSEWFLPIVDPDRPLLLNTEANARYRTATVPHSVASVLLHPENYPMGQTVQPIELLLTAVGQALATVTSHSTVTIHNESHGRHPWSDDIDVSRTIGWFTTVTAVRVNSVEAQSTNDWVRQVKHTLRSAPSFAPVLTTTGNPPEVVLNFVGNTTGADALGCQGQAPWVPRLDLLPNHPTTDPHEPRAQVLEITGTPLEDGELEFTFVYCPQVVSDRVMGEILNALQDTLRNVAKYHQFNEREPYYTPSDFPLLRGVPLSKLDEALHVTSRMGWVKEPADLQDIYPMLPMQQGLLSISSRDRSQYIVQFAMTITGVENSANIHQALKTIVARYDILRTRFLLNWSHGSINGLQVVTRDTRFPWREVQNWEDVGASSEVDCMHRQYQAGLDVTTDPLFRFTVKRLGSHSFRLILLMHHALLDGWSGGLMLKDLKLLLSDSEIVDVNTPSGRFRDFVEGYYQKELSTSQVFWTRYLEGMQQATQLALPRPTQSLQHLVIHEHRTVLTSDIPQLQQLLTPVGVTLYSLVKATWALVLSRYTGNLDVVFANTVSGRSLDVPGVESIVGCLINTLPCRIIVDEDSSVVDFLRHIEQEGNQLVTHEHCPIPLINSWMKSTLDCHVNDLLHTFLVLGNFPVMNSQGDRVRITDVVPFEFTDYAFTVMIDFFDQDLVLRINYDQRKYDNSYAAGIFDGFVRVFNGLVDILEKLNVGGVSESGCLIREIPLFSTEDSEKLTESMPAPTCAIDATLCVHDILRREAYSIGDCMAIEYGDSIQWTYSELYQRSRYIAYGLLASGVRREEPVGLVIDRHPSAIAAMFGILMAGAAYVPMNADFPVERIRFIVQDCGIRVVLTNTSVDVVGVQVLDIDTLMNQPAAECPLPLVKPTDLSHIIYTSGTTGNPKGVQQEHRTVANYVQQPEEVLGIVPGLRMMQSMSLASDCSTIEVFGGLCNGVTLVLRTDMLDTLAKVDTVMLTPSVLATIDPFRYPNISRVLVGGEALPLHTAERWAKQCRLINVYGPSECFATHAVEYRVGDPVTIGRVIGNIEAYILDDLLRPVPFGVPGEIFLGGIGLTRGYVNRPELNQTKFVANPFNPGGGRLYRSGDLGRWLIDGRVEYFARKDDQVKIRGYRVEPQEVEAVIVECPGIVSAAVLHHDGKLYGFCSPESVDISKVKEFLDQRLPPYMVPQDLFSLESIPLTVVGKIDKHSLKITLTARLAHSDERVVKGPTNATEEAIHQAMGEALNISLDHLDVRDSFFQLGGDSILAIRFSSLCREHCIQLSIAQIFRYKSVVSLAELVSDVDIADAALPRLAPWELTLLDYDSKYIPTESVTFVVAEELLSEFPSTLSSVVQTISLFNSRYDSVARRLVHQPHPVVIIEQGVEAPHRLDPSQGVWLSGTYTRQCNGLNMVTLMAHLVPLARGGGWSTIFQGMVKKCPDLVASPNPSTVDTILCTHAPKNETGATHQLTISYSGNPFHEDLLHSGLHAPLSVVVMAGFLTALQNLHVFDSVGIVGSGHLATYITKRLNSVESTSQVNEFQYIKQWYYDQLVQGDNPDKPETPVLYHYSDVCQPHGIPLVEQRTSFCDTMYDTQAAVIYQPSSLVLQFCHHNATVAESLLATWEAQVNKILDIPEQLRGTEHAFIPADFPHLTVTSNDLDELMSEIHQDLGIPPAAVQDVYPLSTMQQNFVVSTLRDPTSYIVQHVLRITGALDLVKYRAVWDELGLRHTILRTKFLASRMVQVVTDRMDIDWVVSDTPLSTSNEEYQHTMRQLGFDLFGGHPLLRMHLFPDSDGHGWLCFIAIHHAVIDGWSYQLVMNESLSLYHDLHLTAKVLYRLFIESVSAGETTEDKKYWTNYLEGFESTPNLPFPRMPGIRMCQKDAVVLSRTAPLHRLCRTWGITFNVLLRAVWALTLTQYLGQPSEVTFGVMVSGRDGRIDGLDRLVGPTTNTLPFRAKVDPRKSVVEWLQELAEQSNQLLEHEQTSLVDIKHWAGLDTDDHLFQTMITVGRYLETSAPSRDSLIEYHSLKGYNETEYPLMASFDEPVHGEILHITILARHEPHYLDELVNHIGHLLLQLETVDSTSLLGRSLLQVFPAAVTQVQGRIPEPTMARNDLDGLVEEVQQAYLALTPHVASVSCGQSSEKSQNSNPQLFWETYLQGVVPTPDLPLPKPSSNRLESVTEQFNIPLSRIQDWCGKLEITTNSLVRGLWTMLMGRYLAKSTREVIFGASATEYDGNNFGIEEIAGLTVITVPFRVKVDPTYSVNSWLQYIHTQSGILKNYSHVDLADIEAWVNDKPLFQSVLTNIKLGSRGMPNLSGAIEEELRSTSEDDRNLAVYSLVASFAEDGGTDRLQLQISGKHETGYYLSMMCYLNAILEILIDDSPSANRLTLANLLDQIPRLELERIQTWSQGIRALYDGKPRLVHDLVLQDKLPSQLNTVALVSLTPPLEFTYYELITRAQQVAQSLMVANASSRFVILFFERSSAFVMSMLGTLIAGRTCVPMDATHTSERLVGMKQSLGEAHPVVLTSQEYYDTAEKLFDGTIICVDDLAQPLVDNLIPSGWNPPPMTPTDVAFVYFTSGSTGKPKAVPERHESVVNYILGGCDILNLPPRCRFLQAMNIGFDSCLLELFTTFHTGGTVVLQSDNLVDSLGKVDACMLTPSMLQAVGNPSEYPDLRIVVTVGEPLPFSLAEKWSVTQAGQVRLFNTYGPTETVVTSHFEHVTLTHDDSLVTIGRTIPNAQCYILDDKLDMVPIGVIGEICIGGIGVCQGYLDDEESSRDAFVPNPFGSGRLYRAGDLGCWLPDGRVYCMGRKDNQVKLRGFRIELGEVESAVYKASPHVQQVVALVKQGKLVVYVTSVDQQVVSITELRKCLSQALPSFMVPDYVISIAEIPHNSNGKVDRKQLSTLALPYVDDSADVVQYDFSPMEKELFTGLQGLIKDILRLTESHPPIRPGSSFFKLGGDSITAIQLWGRSKRELGLNFHVRDIFDHQGILGALVKHASQSSGGGVLPVNTSVNVTRYPCTPLQLGMISALIKDRTAYILQASFTVGPSLDILRFQRAWSVVVENNPTLRTRFDYDKVNDQWMQVIVEHIELEWQIFTDKETYLAQDHKRGFTVDGPLIRCGYHPNKHQWVLTIHHSITDGWTSGLIFEQVIDTYKLAEGELVPRNVDNGYAQFAHYVSNQSTDAAREFWQRELEGVVEGTLLSDGSTNTTTPEKAEDSVRYVVDDTDELNQYIEHHGVTLSSLLRVIWALVLRRYTGREKDVVFGVVVSGRNVPVPNVDRITGLCINTIPCRVIMEKYQTVEALITSVHQGSIRTHGYDCYPLGDVHKWSGFPANQEMFNTLLVVENLPYQSDGGLDLHMESVLNPTEYPLSALVYPSQDQLEISMNYHTSKFTAMFVQQMLDDFVHTLRSLLIDNSKALVDLSVHFPALHSFVHNPADYPARHAHYYVEQQIQNNPDNQALYDLSTDQGFTYGQLDTMSHYVAYMLLKAVESKSMKADQIVGIVARNTPGLVVAQLAVWKLGLSFVVIDPEYPMDRIQFIMSDTQCIACIGYGREPPCSVQGNSPWISLEGITECLLSIDPLPHLPKITVDPHDLAYVIYTSGSTGQPKGVLVEHGSAAHYFYSYQTSVANITSQTTLPTLVAPTFDAAIGELWTTLSFGGTVLLTHKREDFSRALCMATKIFATPSLLSYFDPHEFSHLQQVVLGGEPAELELIRKWQLCGIPQVVNEYGPSEVPIGSHCKVYDQSSIATVVSVGQPLPGYKGVILDSWMIPVPVGVIGEIWLGGETVARGYLHREELTRERFVDTPTWGRLYRTGDLARWLPNGDVQILGRVDNQVKVRGFRVELEEVERVILASVPDISRVCIAYDYEMKILLGFVTPEDANVDQVLDALQDRVPHYMVPNSIVPVSQFPLSHNGKTDRKALLALPRRNNVEQNAHIFTPMETKLVAVLADVLKVNPAVVSPPKDTFFTLGGNSISAMHFVARCKNNGIHIDLVDINRRTTIAALAKHAREGSDELVTDVQSTEFTHGPFSLTPTQRSYFSSDLADPHQWPLPLMMKVTPPRNVHIWRDIVTSLVSHHDMMRARFEQVDGEWRGRVLPIDDDPVKVNEVTLANDTSYFEVLAEINRAMNFTTGPIYLAYVLNYQGTQYFYLALHHLITDNMSMNLLARNIRTLLNGQALPEKTLPYAVWSQNLDGLRQGISLDPYQLPSEDELVLPPVDVDQIPHSGPICPQVLSSNLDLTTTLALEEFGHLDISVEDIILTGLLLAYTNVFNCSSIPLQYTSHGRNALGNSWDVSHTVGFFVNLCPMVLRRKENDDLASTLNGVQSVLRGVSDFAVKYMLSGQTMKSPIAYNFLGTRDISDSAGANGVEVIDVITSDEYQQHRVNMDPMPLIFLAKYTGECLTLLIMYDPILCNTKHMHTVLQKWDEGVRHIVHQLKSQE
ncbi:hypothetical protein IWQ62_000928, partial [Dispira parvispora]